MSRPPRLGPHGGSLGPALWQVASPNSCGWACSGGQGPAADLIGHSRFVGLPEGGPPYHHGHLPAGAALRVPHRQVGWGWGRGRLLGGQGSRDRPSPLSSPSPRAPLSTPRLLINKEKTGQVSPLRPTPPPPHTSPTSPPPGSPGTRGQVSGEAQYSGPLSSDLGILESSGVRFQATSTPGFHRPLGQSPFLILFFVYSRPSLLYLGSL